MKRKGLYFERNEYSGGLQQPHYRYLGYSLPPLVDKEDLFHPVSLHFDRDEIIFTFQEKKTGLTYKIFSLYIADGDLNHKALSRKIEHYWRMPLWTPPKLPEKLEINQALLSKSFFSTFCEIHIDRSKDGAVFFQQKRLFNTDENNLHEKIDITANSIRFQYCSLTQGNFAQDIFERQRCSTYWEVDKIGGETKDIHISTTTINFRHLLLDFLFELDFSRTFEDQNFFKLQPVIQNNKLLDALSRKCSYLNELRQTDDIVITNPAQKLSKPFLAAERNWLEACVQNQYQEIFESDDSVFAPVEEEVASMLFGTRIGKIAVPRAKRFTREDHKLRNHAASFFLRRYSLWNAFKTLMPPIALSVGIILFSFIPFGELLIGTYLPAGNHAGYFCFGIPILGLVVTTYFYSCKGINLFKLLLPRMFLGIMLGWASFWENTETWTTSLLTGQGKTVLTLCILTVFLFLYIFTDIRNKLVRISDSVVLQRSIGLFFFAALVSFILGFYVIQLKAVPVLEASGFLTRQNLSIPDPHTVPDPKQEWISYRLYQDHNLENKDRKSCEAGNGWSEAVDVWKDPNQEKIKLLEEKNKLTNGSGKLFVINNFKQIETWWGEPLYYIWSLHLTQFMIAIMVGLMLQLLWEDRPITEPL